jgi:hypothetical protein
VNRAPPHSNRFQGVEASYEHVSSFSRLFGSKIRCIPAGFLSCQDIIDTQDLKPSTWSGPPALKSFMLLPPVSGDSYALSPLPSSTLHRQKPVQEQRIGKKQPFHFGNKT